MVDEALAWDDPRLQVASDSRRTAKYRLLQSWYREHVLHARYGTYLDRAKLALPCGSLLHLEDVQQRNGLNFLSDDAARYAGERAPKVITDHGTLELGRLRHNMLSSMPMCFSIFGHLRARPDRSLALVRELFDRHAIAVVDMECEWKPSHNPLGDRTAFDAIIVTERADGRRHLIGIETKYTESFSVTEYTSSVYEQLHDRSRWFRPDSSASLIGGATNQLWRNWSDPRLTDT
jgi:hypothetical protein